MSQLVIDQPKVLQNISNRKEEAIAGGERTTNSKLKDTENRYEA
jgi:hypothetical protein